MNRVVLAAVLTLILLPVQLEGQEVQCEETYANPGLNMRGGPGTEYAKKGTAVLDPTGQLLVGKRSWIKK